MSQIEKIKKDRINKLKKIQNPYPEKTFMKYHGRVRSVREHGSSCFAHLNEQQIYLKKDELKSNLFNSFKELVDIGDFIEVNGKIFKTKTGEKTVLVSDWRMLAKSLRPLPEKWHGLKNQEIRFRKRYLDLLMNKESSEKFIIRSKIITSIRQFLDKNNFLEVETPILQTLYGGALAKPFKTHLNALDMNLYLRIAPELYLKRLLVGGYERVYEIGRCFRNEGMDKNHNPDFTMLEFYSAYWDYEILMEFSEKLFLHILQSLGCKDLKIKFNNKTINFKTPWPRITYKDLFTKYANLDIDKTKKSSKELDQIYKDKIRDKLQNPVFFIDTPVEMNPLAKAREDEPEKAARFQLVAGGVELVNAFSELNSPIEQKARFRDQEKLQKAGDQEAHSYDKDYVEALEYGMPPAAGFGMGIDRLTALLTNSKTLREVILFPAMRRR
ncbi:lysine--tRNA ligase [bacterium]|nr:lysine--tRNA ligase [bacterium]|tara:strand:- start:5480 stop:6802 length:1323 start_codon:yes stop_codon:yes gene_type:complete